MSKEQVARTPRHIPTKLTNLCRAAFRAVQDRLRAAGCRVGELAAEGLRHAFGPPGLLGRMLPARLTPGDTHWVFRHRAAALCSSPSKAWTLRPLPRPQPHQLWSGPCFWFRRSNRWMVASPLVTADAELPRVSGKRRNLQLVFHSIPLALRFGALRVPFEMFGMQVLYHTRGVQIPPPGL